MNSIIKISNQSKLVRNLLKAIDIWVSTVLTEMFKLLATSEYERPSILHFMNISLQRFGNSLMADRIIFLVSESMIRNSACGF